MFFDRAHALHEVIDLFREARGIARGLFERFETLAALCPAQIVNCTPDSALRCVPYQPLEEALARAELAA